MAVHSFEDLRTWQAARRFKLAAYTLTESGTLAKDFTLTEQLRDAAASAVSNIAEGFGRFDPVDNARFLKVARASLLECRNHLIDAVDRGHISEETRQTHHALIQAALMEIGGMLDYLQSPEAKKNAERIKQNRFERRSRRRRTLNPEP